MPVRAPKKAAAPKKPAKPSTRSKTGNSACSQAASNWQLAIRGKAPLDPDTYKTLGKCRAMARSAKSADDRADMGYNLSEQGRTALKGRLQKRFDQGLITQKSRQDRLKTLLAQRKEKITAKATGKSESASGNAAKNAVDVPQKNRLKNEIVGPSGAKITGYNWSSHLEERYSHREDGLVLKRVSNWDNATKSEGTGRSIVHSFFVTHPDNRITVEGIGSAQKILGISETRLKTIAKNEADAQRYRSQQNLSEVKIREAIAQPSFVEANRDLRIRLGNAPGAEQFYNDSTTYRKDGKFLRVRNTLADAMQERGWQPYNRSERSKKSAHLLAQRKEKQAQPPAPAPAPVAKSREAAIVEKVRSQPGYYNARTVLSDNNKRNVTEKLISTFVMNSIASKRVPSKVLDDMRDLRNAWISRAGGNDIKLPDQNARPTFYMRPPVDAKGSEKRSLEKKAENVRKFWRIGQNEEGGMDKTGLLHVAQASAAAKKAGKNHKVSKRLNSR